MVDYPGFIHFYPPFAGLSVRPKTYTTAPDLDRPQPGAPPTTTLQQPLLFLENTSAPGQVFSDVLTSILCHNCA